MAKILLTGATGFIGSNLSKKLLTDGHKLCFTLMLHETNPFENDKRVKSYLLNNDGIYSLIEFIKRNQIDGVIHLASFVQSANHVPDDIEKLIDTNLKFSTLVLEAAVQAEVKWFINTGTYWQHYNNANYSPVNLYAATKQAFMDIARYYWETNKINFCTIMLFDTYGPNDSRPKIFNLWERIARTDETLDMSQGEQLIDISHVDDIVSAFSILSLHLQNRHTEVKNGDVFAVKANKRYTLKELAVIFEETTKSKLKINWGGRQYREREVMTPWISSVVVPGWVSKISIEQGIKQLMCSL
ncbi:Nucleoside-diphosphate-sugar epimerase [Flavobacterium fluvii]|uniref:Nucleoside-diphosphate-sugar epimerase n=1 Tax=Flavobacterium fluvii TaxID=468056 RepID=A0A1M5IK03_9FLAO|nr:NAD(P)-dependent oxidoreductase [Flavobacterium fluvii]SHG28668.1 Nucleoside-diphosphate-sugar epimerase [Flavobacterium fluvii]